MYGVLGSDVLVSAGGTDVDRRRLWSFCAENEVLRDLLSSAHKYSNAERGLGEYCDGSSG